MKNVNQIKEWLSTKFRELECAHEETIRGICRLNLETLEAKMDLIDELEQFINKKD